MSLAHEYGMKSPIDSLSGNRSICEETIQKVKSYFLENSWTCPGRKDVVIVRDKKKGKEKRQKHYMLTTFVEASFKTENPGCKICFSKFCDMRPPEVKLVQDIPHSSWLCIYHENVRLLLVTLNKYVKTIPMEFRSFIELIVCDQNSEDCKLEACSKSPTFTALKPKESISGITWWQWNSNENGRVEKQELTGEIVFNSLKNYISIF